MGRMATWVLISKLDLQVQKPQQLLTLFEKRLTFSQCIPHATPIHNSSPVLCKCFVPSCNYVAVEPLCDITRAHSLLKDCRKDLGRPHTDKTGISTSRNVLGLLRRR